MKNRIVCLFPVVLFLANHSLPAQEPPEKQPAEDPWQKMEDLQPIVVTGTKTAKLLKESPVTTHIVKRKRMEVRGDTNLFEALRGTSGVVTEVNCQNCNFTGVRLNGLDSKYNQILFNGVPVIGSLAQVYLYQQIPESMIERVEVVKGGGSTLYGGGAVGGVINVLTRIPRKDYAELKSQQSWIGGKTPNNNSTVALSRLSENKKMGLYVYGGSQYNSAHFQDEDEFSEINSIKMQSIGFTGFIKPIEDGELSYTVLASQEKRRGGSDFDQEVFHAGIAEAIESANYIGILKWQQKLGEKLSYNLYSSASRVERETYYGSNIAYHSIIPGTNLVNPNVYRYANWRDYQNWQRNGSGPIVNANGEINFSGDAGGEFYGNDGNHAFGDTLSNVIFVGADVLLSINDNHKILVGYQQSIEDMRDKQSRVHDAVDRDLARAYTGQIDWQNDLDYTLYNNLQNQGITRLKYVNPALFIQYEAKIGKLFDLVAGIRGDKHSALNKTIYSPRLALVSHLTKWLDWRNSYSTGFRPPQVFVEDFHLAVVSGEVTRIQNDPYLSSETSRSYSSSFTFDYTVDKVHIEHLVGGFYTRLYDAFIEQPAAGNVFLRRNSEGAEVYGGELETKVFYKNWELSVSFTRQRSLYMDARRVLDENDPANLTNYDQSPVMDATQTLQIGGRSFAVTIPESIMARYPLLFGGGTYSKEFAKVPSYYGNILLTYKHQNLSVSGDMTYWGRMYIPHLAGYIAYDRWEKKGYMKNVGFRVAYKFFRDRDSYLEAFVGVKNAFNDYQKDLDKGIFRDVNYFYGPAQPRTYYTGLKARF